MLHGYQCNCSHLKTKSHLTRKGPRQYRPPPKDGEGNAFTGWPRHRENREFGSYFFQTGKTQGILL